MNIEICLGSLSLPVRGMDAPLRARLRGPLCRRHRDADDRRRESADRPPAGRRDGLRWPAGCLPSRECRRPLLRGSRRCGPHRAQRRLRPEGPPAGRGRLGSISMLSSRAAGSGIPWCSSGCCRWRPRGIPRGASRRWRTACGTISGSTSPSRSATSAGTMSGPASAGSSAARSHEIPEAYLAYAGAGPAGDLASLLGAESPGSRRSCSRSRQVWGFVDDEWLREAVGRFGPLTHHIQLKASILMDALRANGIAIDAARWEEKLGQVRAVREPSAGSGCGGAATSRARKDAARRCSRSWRSSSANIPRRAEAYAVGREVLHRRGGPGGAGGRGRLLPRLHPVPGRREAGGHLPEEDGAACASTPASVT